MLNFNRNSCVNLTSDNQIVNLTQNQNDFLIEVLPNMWPPIVQYDEQLVSNNTVLIYQWCGPLIFMMLEFAKRIKANLRFYPQTKDLMDLQEDYITNGKEHPHIALFPFSSTEINGIVATAGGRNSRYVGYDEKSCVVSRTIKKEWPLFEYFTCFDIEIYYMIILSIIVISIMICQKKRSFKPFFEIVWQYTSVILSDYFSINAVGNYERSFAIIWLLICNILLAAFSGHFWDLLVRSQPIDKINSLEDLHTEPQWSNKIIITTEYLDGAEFIRNDGSDMAQDFRRRTIFGDPFEFVFEQKMDYKVFPKLYTGEQVLILDKLVAHYYKGTYLNFGAHYLREGYDYHISEKGLGMKPYFIGYSSRFNKTMSKKLDDFIGRLVESGLLEHEIKKVLNIKGYGPDIFTKVDTNEYKFGPLTWLNMKGVFIPYMMVLNVSIIVFIIELFTVTYYYVCLKSLIMKLIAMFASNQN